jgi:hypothetical protein
MIKKMNRWVFLTLTGVLFLGWMVLPASGQSYTDGPDVRIPDTFGEETLAKIDFHQASGNIFALVCYNTIHNWSLYMSTDMGSTWDFKCSMSSSDGFQDVDLVVADDYLYVGYISISHAENVKLLRYFGSTGARDSVYGIRYPLDASPNTFTDIALVGVSEYDRIYLAAVQSNNAIRWAWDNSTDGTTFYESSPAGVSAAEGLDMAYNMNDENGWYLFLSYIGNDNGVPIIHDEA